MDTQLLILKGSGWALVIVHLSMALLLLRDFSDGKLRRRLAGPGAEAAERRGRLSCLGYLTCALGLLGLGFCAAGPLAEARTLRSHWPLAVAGAAAAAAGLGVLLRAAVQLSRLRSLKGGGEPLQAREDPAPFPLSESLPPVCCALALALSIGLGMLLSVPLRRLWVAHQLRTGDSGSRLAALETLLGDRYRLPSAGLMFEVLHAMEDPDPQVRGLACRALMHFESASMKGAVPQLAKALRSSDSQVALEAAEALGRIGPEALAALPDLIAALKGSDPELRTTAAYAIGSVGSEARPAIPALRALLDDPGEALLVRQAAEGALLRIKYK